MSYDEKLFVFFIVLVGCITTVLYISWHDVHIDQVQRDKYLYDSINKSNCKEIQTSIIKKELYDIDKEKYIKRDQKAFDMIETKLKECEK